MTTQAAMDRADAIQAKLEKVLRQEQASSLDGCSALANALLKALVAQRKDPAYRFAVSEQMRRLAAKLVDLAGAGDDTVADRILDDAKVH